MPWKLGSALTAQDQQRVLAKYVHRFTGEHRPQWAGRTHAVQFVNDRDWLAHTQFRVNGKGRLDGRARYCMSNPTWPQQEAAE